MHGCYVASDAASQALDADACYLLPHGLICMDMHYNHTWHSGDPIWEGRIRSQGACMLEALSGMEMMEVPIVGFTMQQQDMQS